MSRERDGGFGFDGGPMSVGSVFGGDGEVQRKGMQRVEDHSMASVGRVEARGAGAPGAVDEQRMLDLAQEGRADMYETYGFSELRFKALLEVSGKPDKRAEYEKGVENLREEIQHGLEAALEDDMVVALDRLQALEPYEKTVPRTMIMLKHAIEKFRETGDDLTEEQGRLINDFRDLVDWAIGVDNVIHGLAHITTMHWDGAGAIATAVKNQRLEMTAADFRAAFKESTSLEVSDRGREERKERIRMEDNAVSLILAVATRHQRGKGTETTGVTMTLNANQVAFIDEVFGVEAKHVAGSGGGEHVYKKRIGTSDQPVTYWNWFAPPKDQEGMRDVIQAKYAVIVEGNMWKRISDGSLTVAGAKTEIAEKLAKMELLKNKATMTRAEKKEKRKFDRANESFRLGIFMMMGTCAASDLWGMDITSRGGLKLAGGATSWATDEGTVSSWAQSGIGWNAKGWTVGAMPRLFGAAKAAEIGDRAPGEMDYVTRARWSPEFAHYVAGLVGVMEGNDKYAEKVADLQRFLANNGDRLIWETDATLKTAGARQMNFQFGAPATLQINFFRSAGWWKKMEGRNADGSVGGVPAEMSKMSFDEMRHLPVYWQFVTWSQTALVYSLENSGFDGDVQKKFLENTASLAEQIKRIDLGTRYMPDEQKMLFLGLIVPLVTAEWMAVTLGFFGRKNMQTIFDVDNFHKLSVAFERQFSNLEIAGMKVGPLWAEVFHYYSTRFELLGYDEYRTQMEKDLGAMSERTTELKKLAQSLSIPVKELDWAVEDTDIGPKLSFKIDRKKVVARGSGPDVK